MFHFSYLKLTKKKQKPPSGREHVLIPLSARNYVHFFPFIRLRSISKHFHRCLWPVKYYLKLNSQKENLITSENFFQRRTYSPRFFA